MSSVLPARLLHPAKLIFEILAKKKVAGIVFGGAALGLNGSHRFTRDIDINVTSFSFKRYLDDRFLHREGSSRTRLRVTYLDPVEAIKIDMATDKAELIPQCLPFTTVFEGVRYALPPLLLADKIVTFTERWADARRVSDEYDILFLIERMMAEEQNMPLILKQLILKDGVTKTFLNMVSPDLKVHYEYFFEELGVT